MSKAVETIHAQYSSLLYNRSGVWHKLESRKRQNEIKNAESGSWDKFEYLLYNHFYPDARLYPEDGTIVPYFDQPERFNSLPETIEMAYDTEMAWDARELVSFVFPKDQVSQTLIPPFITFLETASQTYYDNYIDFKGDKIDHYYGSAHPHFARITESQAFGVVVDKLYQALGKSWQILTGRQALNTEIDSIVYERTHLDLDLALINYENKSNIIYFLQLWEKSRSSMQYDNTDVSQEGTFYHYSKTAQNSRFYDGWRIKTDTAVDGTGLAIIECGRFKKKNLEVNDYGDANMLSEDLVFSIDISVLPKSKDFIVETNTRASEVATFADRNMCMALKPHPRNESQIVVGAAPFDWYANKYGRNRWYIFTGEELFEHREFMIDICSRALKQMSNRVGSFIVPEYFGTMSDVAMNSELWQYVTENNWVNVGQRGFVDSIHLSPLVTGAQLLPNARLDQLTEKNKRRLATYGIDHTLSFGQLWPHIFCEMSDEQMNVFLDNLPDQAEYVHAMLENPSVLENQGMYYILQALQKAGIEIPEGDGSLLSQAQAIFCHPDFCRFPVEQLSSPVGDTVFETASD